MKVQIMEFATSKFVGISMEFSFSDYRIFELWNTFMPRRNEIKNRIGSDFYNVQINPENFDFSPTTNFQKWAVVPVKNWENIPDNMQALEIKNGLYAVFNYNGDQNNIRDFFEKIYKDWLPNSDYELDNRAQFEILGEKYQRNNPESEEQIWIPIRRKY
jgi:AraC family transcriptional regulator